MERRRRTSLVFCAVALLVGSTLVGVPRVGAEEHDDLPAAVEGFRDSSADLVRIDAQIRSQLSIVDGIRADLDAGESDLRRQQGLLSIDEAALASFAVAAYTHMGGELADDEDRAFRVMTARAAASQELRDSVDRARTDLRRTARLLDGASRDITDLERDRLPRVEATASAAAELESRLAEAGATGLTAAGYVASVDAAVRMAHDSPACHLSPALLLGATRVLSGFGRPTLDPAGQSTDDTFRPIGDSPGLLGLTAADWEAHGADADLDGDGTSTPRSLGDSTLVAARVLCAGDVDHRRFDDMRAATARLARSARAADMILASGRHFARSPGTDLGEVVEDPARAAAAALLANVPLPLGAGSSIRDLLEWSRERLGTPYSQCLGDVRPEDPPCPAGTNRFGNGFFDCSGFVSAAYAAIGRSIPRTTDAMAMDPAFMAAMVATSVEPESILPGDILLADGHVAIWSGEGRIIHANGIALVEEGPPTWFVNGVFAVLRPLASG